MRKFIHVFALPIVFLLIIIMSTGGYFAIRYSNKSIDKSIKVDFIRVEKGKRLMHMYSKGLEIKTYRISLGRDPVGDKLCQGDNKTPEGRYFIKSKDPVSRFHKSLWISYPDQQDIEEAKRAGKNPGGGILIHGITNGFSRIGRAHLLIDWTRGCIAVTNKEIDELYEHVNVGVPIEIVP
jgi:murein L,D-transpeptidase YafK